jgi:hypothetical protein
MHCEECDKKDARIKELELVASSAAYVCQSAQVDDKLRGEEIFDLACALTAADIPAPGDTAAVDRARDSGS